MLYSSNPFALLHHPLAAQFPITVDHQKLFFQLRRKQFSPTGVLSGQFTKVESVAGH
jgi:hypothetical protein